jgi:hypothetical protein
VRSSAGWLLGLGRGWCRSFLGRGDPLAYRGTERFADPVEEILHRRFGDPGEYGSVDSASKLAERRDVSGADRELGAIGTERRDLQICIERREEPDASGRRPA